MLCVTVLSAYTDIGDLDTQRSFFVESGRKATRYLRILRICFVKPFDGREVCSSHRHTINGFTIAFAVLHLVTLARWRPPIGLRHLYADIQSRDNRQSRGK